MNDPIRTTRHNLRGKLNALKLCVSALEILQLREEKIEFLQMIESTADSTTAALDEMEAAMDRAGVAEKQ